jgi:4-amino-4-deoxy-L-arabinose transferase-like glycosyltransferase
VTALEPAKVLVCVRYAPDHPISVKRNLTLAAVAGVAALGVALRFKIYAARGPLTLDEAMLALNVARRGMRALMAPLALEQTAPIGFLWLARAAVRIGGVGELALRAIPFVAGVLFAPVVAVAAWWLVSARAAVVAGVLALLCPLDIQYAATFKPYAVDATVAAAIIVAALGVVRYPSSRWAWTGWVVCCVVVPFVSAASVFVTVAAFGALALSPIARTSRARIIASGSAWLGIALVNYWFFQRATVTNGYMQRYWAGAFLQPPLHEAFTLARARAGVLMDVILLGDTHAYPAVWRVALLGVVVFGWWSVARRSGAWAAVLLAGPFVAVAGAAVLRVYPLSDRTLLFLAPLCILSVAAAGGVLLACVLLLPPTVDAVTLLARGGPRAADGRALRATTAMVWRQHVEVGEPVYVFSRSLPAWTFYTTDWSKPDLVRADSLIALATALGPNAGNAPARDVPVQREGFAFTYRGELVGIATGMEDALPGPYKRVPDPGWATNEAARIRAVASPVAWVYFNFCRDHCERRLLDTLVAGAGGQIADSVVTTPVQAFRFAALAPARMP